MNAVSLICFSFGIGIAVLSYRRWTDILSPGRMFLCLWLIVIGLANLKLSALQQHWSAESWIQVLLGPASFLAGTFVIYVMNSGAALTPVSTIRLMRYRERIDGRRLLGSILLVFFLYLFSFGVIYFIKGVDPPLLSSNPGLARYEFTMFGLGLFLHNVVLVLFLTVIYHVFIDGHRTTKRVLKLLSFLSVATYFLLLQRFQLALAMVMCFTLVYYYTRHLRPRTVAIYVGLVLAAFSVVTSLRSGLGEAFIYYLYRDSKMRFSADYAVFTEPYMYISMNLENFARGIEKLDHFSYGAYTFDFVLASTGLKHWVEEYFFLNPTPYLVSQYNTYTAYWSFYRDFGPAGLVAIPFCIGAFISYMYFRLRSSPSLIRLSAYGGCVFIMLFSFFNNSLQFLWFVYNIAAVFLILRYIRLPHPPVEGSR